MQGIAQGAGVHFTEILALNARTELLAGNTTRHPNAATALSRNRILGVADYSECTTLVALPAATTDGTTLLAQTWDWIGLQYNACIILNIREPGRPSILTLTEAGMVAKMGLNSAGLGVCMNILRSNNDGHTPGLPIHVLLRRLLQTTSLSAALAYIQQTQPAASSCITMADLSGQAACLEITPASISAISPNNALLVHTNHCLAAATQATERPLDATSSSIPRYQRATRLLYPERGHITRRTLAAILSDQYNAPFGICRTPDRTLHSVEQRETIAAVILELPAYCMHLAPGRPSEVAFVSLYLAPPDAPLAHQLPEEL